MLASVSRFWYGEPLPATRFNQCEELKVIRDILTQLRTKEAELAKAQKAEGAASLAYGKYTVISLLVFDLDTEIEKFNLTTEQQTRAQDLIDIRALVAAMITIVDAALNKHKDLLNSFRDNAHDNISNALLVTSFLATVTTIYAAPFSLIPKLALYWGSTKVVPTVNESIKEKSGLNEEQTRTVLILKGLSNTLAQLDQNLGLVIENLRPAAKLQ